MGCDGGTIPKRHELVKGPKKVEQVDKNAALAARWNYCAISQRPLRKPIVACELGRLYNKDAVIEYLLDTSPEKCIIETAMHVKNLKDVKQLNLTDNPTWMGDKANTKGDKYEDLQRAAFICPVVGLEMNGRQKFCYLHACGCVFSERAMKEIKTEVCHKCGESFNEDDVIVLNGSKEEMADLQRKMEERKLKAKLLKKARKSKTTETVVKSALTEEISGPSSQKPKEKKATIGKMLNGYSSSTSTAKSSSTSTPSGKASKLATGITKRSHTETGEKSEAYKSIFTSHSSAKRAREEKPNWITHTAYYY
ncbi:replication termination factor 2 isoform X2 [Scyliorhinus canicula]|uniref:replication termination factor 2 isoform X2 n=1 Tax=Scyliorhinus canicula TaxID=7830 RepID=UPI0018F723F4|nr:replication termination factor 2 isoform X2 [Scyliorhinus canicula]